MKKLYTIIVLAVFVLAHVNAQEVKQQLGEAQSAYNAGKLQDARFALQQTLNEIDMAIGAEILKILPPIMGSMAFVEDDDNITAASLGFAGLFVSRNYYQSEDLNASLQIISDSPLLAGLSTLLALPMFGSDPNQKRIRVGSYRGLMQRSQNDTGVVSWDVQVPIGSTLLTFNCTGIADEKKVTEMVNTIPIDQIAKYAQ